MDSNFKLGEKIRVYPSWVLRKTLVEIGLLHDGDSYAVGDLTGMVEKAMPWAVAGGSVYLGHPGSTHHIEAMDLILDPFVSRPNTVTVGIPERCFELPNLITTATLQPFASLPKEVQGIVAELSLENSRLVQERDLLQAMLDAVGPNESGPTEVLFNKHPLYPILMNVMEQAMYGKGKRHGGNATPFLEQPWVHYSKMHGRGFLTGQAAKKLEEAASTRTGEAFVNEVLGAIVYCGMAILYETARKEPLDENS